MRPAVLREPCIAPGKLGLSAQKPSVKVQTSETSLLEQLAGALKAEHDNVP